MLSCVSLRVHQGDDLMIEADVTLAETTRYPIPIMAHPPMNMSDITLEDWLLEVVRADSGKGIKLDFKSTRVVEPAFRVLARHADFLKGPLILNADVLPGTAPCCTKLIAFRSEQQSKFPLTFFLILQDQTNPPSCPWMRGPF